MDTPHPSGVLHLTTGPPSPPISIKREPTSTNSGNPGGGNGGLGGGNGLHHHHHHHVAAAAAAAAAAHAANSASGAHHPLVHAALVTGHRTSVYTTSTTGKLLNDKLINLG